MCLAPSKGSKILNSQSHYKTQYFQAKGLCKLQTMVQIFVFIISRRNVKVVW